MKLKALPLIISGVAAFASTQAIAAPTVYGKANVSINHDEAKDAESGTSLNSNASRLGFKGSEKVSDNLKAIYKFEYETFVDDGEKADKQTFAQRNIYVGLQGDFGTVAAGRHDTPLKKAQGKVDQFGDLPLGDIKTVISGENRVSNTVWYAAPKMGAIGAVAAVVLNKEGFNEKGKNNSAANTGVSAMVNFKQDGLYLALGLDQQVKGNDTVRLVGQFNAGDFGVGGIYQTAEPSADGSIQEETGLILSGYFKMDKTKLKLQYGMGEVDNNKNVKDVNVTKSLITLGADHKLSKRTKVYGYYSMMDKETETKVGGTTSKSETDESTLGVGIEVKF